MFERPTNFLCYKCRRVFSLFPTVVSSLVLSLFFSLSVSIGSINRAGAVPTFLRTPTMIQSHLDMKPFLQFPMDTAPPHSVGLFPNFNAVRVPASHGVPYAGEPPILASTLTLIS